MGSPVHRVSLGDTWSRQVHPDIDSERGTPPFSVERLTNILDGGIQNTVLRRKVGKQKQEPRAGFEPACFLQEQSVNYLCTPPLTNVPCCCCCCCYYLLF